MSLLLAKHLLTISNSNYDQRYRELEAYMAKLPCDIQIKERELIKEYQDMYLQKPNEISEKYILMEMLCEMQNVNKQLTELTNEIRKLNVNKFESEESSDDSKNNIEQDTD